MVSKTELEAIENFRNATKALKRASADMETNVGLRTILLKKEEGLQKLEDIILGNGIRRDILNFIILKKEQRRQRKEAGLSKREFKELRKREKQRKKELERAKRAKELQEQQEELTREMFGAEEAERIIQARRAQNLEDTIERDMILADAERATEDAAAAERAKAREEEEKAREEEEKKINSLTEAARAIEAAFSGNVGIAFENLSRTIQSFEVSGAIGDVTAGLELVAEQIELQRGDQPTKAEADQERASQEAWKTSQISLLEKIALNTLGRGGAGGAGGDGGGGGSGGKIAKTMGAIGKGIGALGKGIGKGVAFALKGLAIGLKAFANPKILVGAAIFAGAIAIIGAGIAGAAFVLGKALPTLAEGLEPFQKLDGEKLINAGKGMAAVAGGLAAFGGATAIAGLGSLVGGITSGIASLFGGEDPLEKLKQFQEYNFDEPRITNNANAMVSYSKAMASLGGAQAVSGIGAAVGAIGGAIAGLFGADDPLDKMFEFQKYKFDTARIKSNAEAVSAYAEAMKDFPKSPSASVFKAAGDAIIGFLGGETDPFAPMIKFGKRKFNTQGIVTNAKAVKAYAEAIKDFPESPSVSLLTALKNGIIGFLGGETDPFAPMIRFSNLELNTEGIVRNAGAVRAYAEAIKDFPESPEVSLFKGVKDAIIGFLGGDTNPFSPMKKFGDMALNTEGIVRNAGAIKAYAAAMDGLSRSSPPPDSLIEGMERVVSTLGSGNPTGLRSFSNAIKSINALDESKIGLLNKITIPQVMPPTAAEYERIFKAMQSAEPSTIEKVQGFFSNVFGRKPREARQARTPRGAGSAGSATVGQGMAEGATVGQGMAEGDIEGMEGAGMLEAAAKDVGTSGSVGKRKMMLTPKQQKELTRLRKVFKGLRPNSRGQKAIGRRIAAIERRGRSAYNKSVNPNRKKFSGDLTGTSRKMQAAAISSSPPSAGDYGGGPAGGSTMVNNMSAPTTNVNNHTSPMINRPTSRSAETLRAMKNF